MCSRGRRGACLWECVFVSGGVRGSVDKGESAASTKHAEASTGNPAASTLHAGADTMHGTAATMHANADTAHAGRRNAHGDGDAAHASEYDANDWGRTAHALTRALLNPPCRTHGGARDLYAGDRCPRFSPPEPQADDEGDGVGAFALPAGDAGGFAVLLQP